MTITKKTVNGKEQITSCSLANCCLSVQVVKLTEYNKCLILTNEKKIELVCHIDEFKEIAQYLIQEGHLEIN